MKTQIVRIGNSLGIPIPKRLLEQTGLQGEVEIAAEDGTLVIRGIRKPEKVGPLLSKKWPGAGDDELLDDVLPTLSTWDVDEWEWP